MSSDGPASQPRTKRQGYLCRSDEMQVHGRCLASAERRLIYRASLLRHTHTQPPKYGKGKGTNFPSVPETAASQSRGACQSRGAAAARDCHTKHKPCIQPLPTAYSCPAKVLDTPSWCCLKCPLTCVPTNTNPPTWQVGQRDGQRLCVDGSALSATQLKVLGHPQNRAVPSATQPHPPDDQGPREAPAVDGVECVEKSDMV